MKGRQMIYVMVKDHGNNGTFTHIYPVESHLLALDKVEQFVDKGYKYCDDIEEFNKRVIPTRVVMTFIGQPVMLDQLYEATPD